MHNNGAQRKSYMLTNELYFYTATINNWNKLLQNDSNKNVIVNSLSYLSDKGKIDVFAFVIMPNHIHLIWRIKERNGKETPQGSFLKYTAHEFRKRCLKDSPSKLALYSVNAMNKDHEFWQRDPLAIHLTPGMLLIKKWITSIEIQLRNTGIWQTIISTTNILPFDFMKTE